LHNEYRYWFKILIFSVEDSYVSSYILLENLPEKPSIIVLLNPTLSMIYKQAS